VIVSKKDTPTKGVQTGNYCSH